MEDVQRAFLSDRESMNVSIGSEGAHIYRKNMIYRSLRKSSSQIMTNIKKVVCFIAPMAPLWFHFEISNSLGSSITGFYLKCYSGSGAKWPCGWPCQAARLPCSVARRLMMQS